MKYECNKSARLKVKFSPAPPAPPLPREREQDAAHAFRGGGRGVTCSSPNVISMQMKGAGIRGSKEGGGHESQPLPWGLESHIIRVKWGRKQMS